MDNITILKELVTEEERDQLVEWMDKNVDSFVKAKHPGTNRLTTRSNQGFTEIINYPKIAKEIHKRIADKLNIKDFFLPPYVDGMVASIGFKNDECQLHTDFLYYKNTETFHCVLLLTKPEKGGDPILGGTLYNLDERDGLFYNVSKIPHETTKLLGDKPRRIWIFGYCI